MYFLFPYTVFVALLLDLRRCSVLKRLRRAAKQNPTSPLSVAGACTIQEQWKPNCTNAVVKSEPLVLVSWIWSVWVVLSRVVGDKATVRVRDFLFLHVVWRKKKEEEEDFCVSSSCAFHLHQFISFGICEQIRKETSSFSSVKSLQFIQIQPLFFLSLVRFTLVQFSFLQLPPHSGKKLTVCVCLLRLSSTASRSCPSRRSTPGSCRHTGRSRWSRDCCGRRKHDWVPGKKHWYH